MEYYRNKIRNESYRIKTDERYELQKKKQQQQTEKTKRVILLGYHTTEYVTSLFSDIIEPLVNSRKIIARRYQLGAVKLSLILTT